MVVNVETDEDDWNCLQPLDPIDIVTNNISEFDDGENPLFALSNIQTCQLLNCLHPIQSSVDEDSQG